MFPRFRHASSSLLRAPRISRTTLPSTIVQSFSRTVVTKHYTKEHELLSYDDTTSLGRLHITKHASKSLGDVVFVELPKVGQEIAQGDSIGAVESVKAASDIYAPVSGTVYEINEALADKPGIMSSDPESTGWLCGIKISKPDELESLLTAEAYENFCEGD
ncbi:single hybrid motif-containing protein [Hysterangium stoloniferum]|nr:single hybrid motif-containing protein [Hysterangium stoloniferum]